MAGVLGEAEVRDAARRGRATLHVAPGTIVSPSAREAAERLGVELRAGSPPDGAVAGVDHGRAVVRSLYRRAPRWVAPEPRRGQAPRRLGRVAIVGIGAVGATTAHLAAATGLAGELVLIDVVPGLAAAVALDLAHASGSTGSTTRTMGSTSVADVAGAEVVVVTAGRPRTPGMSRADLASVNGRVIAGVAAAVAEHAPDAFVLVVTNPVDEMTAALWSASGLPADRVAGMAGTLDSARFRHAIATEAGVEPRDVDAIVLGRHGEQMVPLVSLATVRGRPLRDVLRPEQLERCVRRTIDGGADVVALRRVGSASVAPAHAILEVLDAHRGARAGPVPLTVLVQGAYGIDGAFAGVPVRLTAEGVGEVCELPLDEEERADLRRSATRP